MTIWKTFKKGDRVRLIASGAVGTVLGGAQTRARSLYWVKFHGFSGYYDVLNLAAATPIAEKPSGTLRDRVLDLLAGYQNALPIDDEEVSALLVDLNDAMQGAHYLVQAYDGYLAIGIDMRDKLKEFGNLTPETTSTVPVTHRRVRSQTSSGTIEYLVTLVDGDAVSCTCPDFHYRSRVCKHMVEEGCVPRKGTRIDVLC